VREKYARTYIAALSALALLLSSSWYYWHGFEFDPGLLAGACILSLLIFIGLVFPINTGQQDEIGVWDIGLVVAIAALGPTWAAIAALPAAVYTGRKEPLRLTFEVSHLVTITYLAGMVFSLTSTPLLLMQTGTPTASVVYGTFVAGVVLIVGNKLIMSTLLRIKYGRAMRETWQEDMSPYLLSDAINVLTAGFGVLALIVYGPVAAFVTVGGAIGSQVLVYRSRHQVRENRELRDRISSLESSLTTSNLSFGTMMIQDLGRRDGFTDRHAAATSVYAADIARELRLDDVHAERVRMAALLHNIGMFRLPEEIITATGRLNSLARKELDQHPVVGEQALSAVPEFREMASWVRWHHERPDGRGYPDKLREAWIPTEARILAVAQAYAAMIIDQPHKPGASPGEARSRLNSGADTEFDGVVVRAFARILDTESEGYRMADDHRFVFPAPDAGLPPELQGVTRLPTASPSDEPDEASNQREA